MRIMRIIKSVRRLCALCHLQEKNWQKLPSKMVVTGSHHHFVKDGFSTIVTIPIHGNKDLKKGLEQKILKDLGLK